MAEGREVGMTIKELNEEAEWNNSVSLFQWWLRESTHVLECPRSKHTRCININFLILVFYSIYVRSDREEVTG